jgi:HrpA-like RNA helicase
MPIANTTNKEDIEDAGYHTTNPTIRGTVSFVDSANGIRLLMCHYDVIEPIMIPRSKMTIPMRKSFSSLSLSSSTFYSLVVIIICILSIDIIIFSSEVVAFLPTTTTLMSSSSSSSSSNTSRMMKSTARSDLTSFCKNNLLTTSLLASSSSLSSSSYEHMPSLEHRLRDVLEQNPNSDITGTAATTDNQQQQQQQLPQLLPIFDVLQSVRESLNIKPNLLLQASPGAGKTTIVPLQLLLDLILAKKEEEGETNDSKDYGDKNNNSHNNNNNKQILVVAPRRVAVRSAAQRMSTLLGEKDMVGNTVGYVMRDDVKISKKGHTRIKVVTDGVLLNMLRDDPLLRNIDTVILDEFHERGVGSDTCLALLREVQQNFRSSNDNDNDILKIVVMSATLLGNGIIEAEEEKDSNNSKDDDDNNNSNDSSAKPLSTGSKLMTTLGGKSVCGIIESEGRQYPIQIQWANQVVKMMSSGGGGGGGGSAVNRIPLLTTLLRDRKLLIETISNVVDKAALKNAPSFGDILVFLPGVAECKGVVRELTSRSSVTNVADVFALYGAMSKEEQDRVLFYPEQQKQGSDQRRRQRVIVSTPIAEASLTIPKVTCVVDSGLRREPRCDTDTGMPRLVSAKISQASSIQRSGRAGRVQEGSCLRLYTESDFDNEFIEQTPPEIGKVLFS